MSATRSRCNARTARARRIALPLACQFHYSYRWFGVAAMSWQLYWDPATATILSDCCRPGWIAT